MRGLGVVLMAAVLVGCAGSSGPSTPAPAPDGWEYRDWSDPDLGVALPRDFECFDGENLVEPLPMPADLLMSCEGGVPTPLGPGDAGWVTVLRGDEGEALDAWLDELLADAVEGYEESRRTVELPAGPATLIDSSSPTDDGRQGIGRFFAFTLPDGRYLQVGFSALGEGTEPPNEEQLRRFADEAIRTLRPSQ